MNTLVLIFLICYAWPISAADENAKAYCFQFTWPGPMYTITSENINCSSSEYKGIPCISPIILTLDSQPLNFTKLWLDWDRRISPNSYISILPDSHTCIKYSYIYNNEVLNTSHYCGKIIEDKTIAITSGCFYYQVDGHTIEACACRSIPGAQPCNTATKQTLSARILLFSVITLFYHFFNK